MDILPELWINFSWRKVDSNIIGFLFRLMSNDEISYSLCPNYYKPHSYQLTRRRAQPVGMKARKEANMSLIVRPQTTNRTVMTDRKPRNRSALRILNMSWKSVPNLRLPIETIWKPHITYSVIQAILAKIMLIREYWSKDRGNIGPRIEFSGCRIA